MKLLFQALIIFSVPPAIIYVLSQMGVTVGRAFLCLSQRLRGLLPLL